MAGVSETITRGVKVRVEPEYLPDHSNPAQSLWVHAYHVTITNESEQVLQLVWRQWIITNANGTEERVSGPGVVGQQPVLKPDERVNMVTPALFDVAPTAKKLAALDTDEIHALIRTVGLAPTKAKNLKALG